jgi:hypothetical protein
MGFLETIKKMFIDEVVQVEQVGQKFVQLEQEIVSDVKTIFEQAKAAALVGNATVNKLKADLQDALARSRDLHQQAIDAANTAIKSAEEDLIKFKSAVVAHTSDLKAQASQITTPVSVPVDNVEVVTKAEL